MPLITEPRARLAAGALLLLTVAFVFWGFAVLITAEWPV